VSTDPQFPNLPVSEAHDPLYLGATPLNADPHSYSMAPVVLVRMGSSRLSFLILSKCKGKGSSMPKFIWRFAQVALCAVAFTSPVSAQDYQQNRVSPDVSLIAFSPLLRADHIPYRHNDWRGLANDKVRQSQ
jgi:hypothetical protein